MTHSDVPTYHVPSADGVRIADPGRWWRCLLIMIVGAGPVGITILYVGDTLAHSINLWVAISGLITDDRNDFSGAFFLPCMALTPIIALALGRNVQAWRTPTLRTVAQANRWIRRLGWAVGWAVLAGILLLGGFFYWSLTHDHWGLILYRVF